ncbi:MAG: site-specific integrase [Betaproteobacteria bacterium]|nr:site-specific integrase [Betaproteobacteria bacterium]
MASIRQLNNKNWQVQIRRVGYPALTKTFSLRQHALQWARRIEGEIDQGIFIDRTLAERTSILELLERYALEITPRKRSANREVYRLNLLKKVFGAYKVATLHSSQVAKFRDQRIQSGISGATVIKELNTLSHVIDIATKEWGIMLQNNPVKQIRKPKVSQGRSRRLEQGEEKMLLEACRKSRNPLVESMVVFAIETGMRLSEILSLEWKDIDIKYRVAKLANTKNGQSRTVPLSQRAIQILETLPRHINNPQLFWTWKKADSFEHTWSRIIKRSEIIDLRFHDLRHEATSRFFEKGLNVMEVGTITGHKTVQMLRRYTHPHVENILLKLE